MTDNNKSNIHAFVYTRLFATRYILNLLIDTRTSVTFNIPLYHRKIEYLLETIHVLLNKIAFVNKLSERFNYRIPLISESQSSRLLKFRVF
jgi:hypothetical protein